MAISDMRTEAGANPNSVLLVIRCDTAVDRKRMFKAPQAVTLVMNSRGYSAKKKKGKEKEKRKEKEKEKKVYPWFTAQSSYSVRNDAKK